MPQKFWNYAKSKLKTRTGVAKLVRPGLDQADPDSLAKSDDENCFLVFASVFTTEPIGPVPQPRPRNITSACSEPAITTELVKKLLQELNPSKLMGPDGVHPRILRELCDVVALPLKMIFETSLRTGIVTRAWREANVSPIFKKEDRSQPSNYRPVSLTSVVCKVMEKILRASIMEHMDNNELLSDRQYGFIPGRSTTLQLLSVLDQWTKILDEGELEVIYLDFRKAFDSVPHRRLIAKIESYGIHPAICRWIEAFMTDRVQRVGVNGKYSGSR